MKRIDFRLAIGALDAPRSSVWHFWSRNSDVYAAHSTLGGVQKLSFHTPDVCRLALTAEHVAERGKSQQLSDGRTMQEWRRDSTPESGSNRVVRVLRLSFPTDVLSTALEPPTKPAIWIEPALPGNTTIVDLMFTRDAEEQVRMAIARDVPEVSHKVVAYHKLPNGEAFCIASAVAVGAKDTLRVPASHGHGRDLIILPRDPQATGRPVRLTLFSRPKDGDLMQAWEAGGFWHEAMTEEKWQAMLQ